jgi:hypothetical protein
VKGSVLKRRRPVWSKVERGRIDTRLERVPITLTKIVAEYSIDSTVADRKVDLIVVKRKKQKHQILQKTNTKSNKNSCVSLILIIKDSAAVVDRRKELEPGCNYYN